MPRNPQHRRPTRRRPSLPPEPLIVEAAELAGWSKSAREHGVRVGDIERLGRGVVAPAAPHSAAEANLLMAQAATLRCDRAVVSHLSGAVAYRIPTFGSLDRPCVTVQSATALRHLSAVHLHRATILEGDVVDVDGLRVLSPARTVMDIAREHGVRAGVVAADDALHRKLVDQKALGAAYEACASWPGRRNARLTVLLADGAAESPLESLSRLCISAAGLPMPRLQPRLCDGHGRFIGRADFYWDEFGVVGEADGKLKYDVGRSAIVSEREREQALWQTGLIVVRWGWADVLDFAATERRLRTALGRGARAGSAHRQWGVLLE